MVNKKEQKLIDLYGKFAEKLNGNRVRQLVRKISAAYDENPEKKDVRSNKRRKSEKFKPKK